VAFLFYIIIQKYSKSLNQKQHRLLDTRFDMNGCNQGGKF
jgi:hypothetical protein